MDYDHELHNGWDRWQNLVLTELKRISETQEALEQKLDPVIIEAAVAKERYEELRRQYEDEVTSSSEIHTQHDKRLRVVEGALERDTGAKGLVMRGLPYLIAFLSLLVAVYAATHGAPISGSPAP